MPDPKAPRTTTDLLRLLERSGIMSPTQLAQATQLASKLTSAKHLARRLIAEGLLTRWQASQLLAGWYKLALGKYRLCKLIDRSDSGRVFQAEHMQLGRSVAIKTLSRRFTDDPDIVREFLEEARQVSRLDHRNVLHVYDVDREGDRYYLVMEYIEGDDLQRLVSEQGPLTHDMVVEIARQAAAGLAYLHQLGMVHRDLCPANLMLDPDGHIKIIGLGMGQLTSACHLRSAESTSVADGATTNPWLAPEQVRTDGEVDARADLFTLGRILQWLLSGQQHPPRPSNAPDITSENPEESSREFTWPDDVPVEFVAITNKLTAMDPNDRYQTADELITALDALAEASETSSNTAAEISDVATSSIATTAEPTIDISPDVTPADEETSSDVPAISTPATAEEKPLPAAGDKREDSVDNDAVALSSRSTPWRRMSLVVAFAVIAFTCIVAGWYIFSLNSPPDRLPDATEETFVTPSSRELFPPQSLPPVESEKPPTTGTNLPNAGQSIKNEKNAPKKRRQKKVPRSTETSPAKTKTNKKPDIDKKPTSKPASAVPKKAPPAPPKPRRNPFQALPTAFNLGSPSDAQAEQILGPVALQVSDPCSLSLLTPSSNTPSPMLFRLTKDPRRKPRVWNIQLSSPDPSQAVTIAHLRIAKQQLMFRWSPESHRQSGAAQLVNCVLRLQSRAFRHDLRLRQPAYTRPLLFNLKKLTTDTRSRLSVAPPSDAIRFEILSLEEPLPQDFAIEPDHPVVVPRKPDTPIWITFPNDEAEALHLKLNPSFRPVSGGNGEFRLQCTACFKLIAAMPPEPMSPKNLAKAEQMVTANQLLRNAAAVKIRQEVGRMRPRDPRRKAKMRELNQAEKAVARAADITNRFETLRKLGKTLTRGATIQFRVFFVVGDCEVDLLRTDVAPETAATAKISGNR